MTLPVAGLRNRRALVAIEVSQLPSACLQSIMHTRARIQRRAALYRLRDMHRASRGVAVTQTRESPHRQSHTLEIRTGIREFQRQCAARERPQPLLLVQYHPPGEL